MKSIVIEGNYTDIVDKLIDNDIDFEVSLFSKTKCQFNFKNINMFLQVIEILEEENVKFYTLTW